MNRKYVSTLLLSCAATLTASPAQALPYPDTDQSVIITYYSDSTRTNEIGWRQYGHCGEVYDIGVHSRYFSIEIANCSSTASGEEMSVQDTTHKSKQSAISKKSTIDQRRFPTDFPICWNIEGKPCHSLGAVLSCTDGTYDDYVCTCNVSWQWQCPEIR